MAKIRNGEGEVLFIHLGGDTSVPLAEVVAVLRADLAGYGPNREMVQSLRAAGKVKTIPGGPPRALVLTTSCLYMTGVSPFTLRRRGVAPYVNRLEEDTK